MNAMDWPWRSGRGTNRVCDEYEESWTWPRTGCEHCGHAEGDHPRRKQLTLTNHKNHANVNRRTD